MGVLSLDAAPTHDEAQWSRPIDPAIYGIVVENGHGTLRSLLKVPLPRDADNGLRAELENSLGHQNHETTLAGNLLIFWREKLPTHAALQTAAKIIRRWREGEQPWEFVDKTPISP